ncbi:MAG: efflux RND transporter periplasmic adaptor subunit [Hyphomicrobium sp.]|uniref:efflux RND transporter periplasmic adaptor subunit n=1 Tax=Hyphomicrobium sp. TaxID=82 RepID=UPI00132B9B6D|nr:efflux RND transporter periplasmic adaptor subunit [Hyphomicrobium sp.]KAB2940536.1 MAG: efflux RND transporter periplasmic adaptor subunit [Hyphomicrobium sp.]MBZ0210319.1 efflux RND transporter periplasmic adaptor subunit [Hyphomicrobium sp.]MCZ7595220.1 efflux RND transporter periplasmic adaptor subunit [Hyphomicrobium sp.]
MPILPIARLAVPLSLVAALLAGCGEAQTEAQGAPPPPPQVSVAKPVQKMVTERDEYVGRFVAFDYVEVRARVSGYLEKIHFKDGQIVKQGDPLFTIDRRPFQTVLEQAKAAVEQAKANLAFAESDLKRGESLRTGTTITQQALDQRLQASRVAAAAVTSQQAAVEQAELDLSFTELKAPISGRIGDRRVSIGNLVSGGSTGSTTLLATIASIDPIRFEFTMDEASYLRYLRMASSAASSAANRGMSLPVRLKLIDEDAFTHEGTIDFVDNTIDRSSGTIRGRALFANTDGRLTPGMFGRIQIATSAPATALLVPDSAIGTEQVRKFVYVLSPDNVATPKYVTLGQVVDGMRVVQGLQADDTIIVNGLMRVRPGAKVTPEQVAAEAGSIRATSSIRTN